MNHLQITEINTNELVDFIYIAKANGFAKTDTKTSLANETSIYSYRQLPWCYNDVYWGNTIERGTEDVSFDLIPIWSMQYRGGFYQEYWDIAEALATFLKSALMNLPKQFPIRGPKEFTSKKVEFEDMILEGEFKYINNWEGDIHRFKGEELIFWNEKKVYYHDYIGGVNRNKHFPVILN